MLDSNILDTPKIYGNLVQKSQEIGFTMPSDLYIGSFLKTLIASKPGGRFLEMGTGIGLSLSWMLDGMDTASHIISLDNDEKLVGIARQHFGNDPRLELICADGEQWLQGYSGEKFDLVFADAWPGKYSQIEKVLQLLKVGGFYVLDDMDQQPNWPKGHQKYVEDLIGFLENNKDFTLTKMNWSTGLVMAVRKN